MKARDALRFHWRPCPLSEIETTNLREYCLDLPHSPFLLKGALEYHLEACATKFPEETERGPRSTPKKLNVYVEAFTLIMTIFCQADKQECVRK